MSQSHFWFRVTSVSVYVLMMGTLLLAISGCASTRVIDRVPRGQAKGYVEFYVPPGKTSVAMPRIYRLEGGHEVSLGQTGYLVKGKKSALRVAEKPGYYSYAIRAGSFHKDIRVKVLDGHVTPVRIAFEDYESRYIGDIEKGYDLTTFWVKVDKESAQPIEAYDH